MTSSSEVYIEATETDPAVRARTAICRIHQRLLSRLAALTGPEAAGGPEPARTALAGFCTGELRRHLAAADEALYAPAAGAAGTRLLVRALRTVSADLNRRIDELARDGGDTGSADAAARTIEAVLAAHFAVEQAVLLPALAELPGTDLPSLHTDLETLLDGGQLEQPDVIDVREIPHGQRHPRIFARYARLAPGQAFTLVNNHDPKPLRREFQATHPGAFSWDYVESGPETWQVRIGRAATDA